MAIPEWARQGDAEVRFDWGPTGVAAIEAAYVVVVDVLRFTTAVDAAVAQGASVYPYRWKDDSAVGFADRIGARLAGGIDPAGPSLSPVRLTRLHAGDSVVLPSPNGSTCAAIAADHGATVIAACLRNARAVSGWLNERQGAVAVIACGERWPDGSLRPALEDHLGAGAVLSGLNGQPSPEACAAAALWNSQRANLQAAVRSSASGLELHARGWDDDLDYAIDSDASATVPVLTDGAFIDARAT